MNDIFEKLYTLYMRSLADLQIGYSFQSCPISQMWELLNLIWFLESGYATDEDIEYIADHYNKYTL